MNIDGGWGGKGGGGRGKKGGRGEGIGWRGGKCH